VSQRFPFTRREYVTTKSGGTVLVMAGKKQTDATQNLPPGEPTQVLPKGTKTGLPKRRDVMALIDRLSGKKHS
jgi:hypothetical protein